MLELASLLLWEPSVAGVNLFRSKPYAALLLPYGDLHPG
ncbi:MAG: hypothetical protein M2R45_03853 [Verrucomicrobia subdivision 3 bacterium]|nr:hypothetical protein [Limisphaerales bacterium]MCS1415809.1 hypothetical protein [Limisphaerales bacterium]